MTRTLSLVLAVLLITACAARRTSIPKWDRYQEGELAGFVRAPGERAVAHVDAGSSPSALASPVRVARGEIWFPDTEAARRTATRVTAWGPDSWAPDRVARGQRFPYTEPTLVVVELRGPSPTQDVRTVVTRDRSFDFGRVPDGAYALKATTATTTEVGTITVSHSADRDARIRIRLWP